MKALDTNMLVRFLVNDHRKQAHKARQILEAAESTADQLLVVTPVVLELMWVLSSVYEYDRNEVIEAMNRLLQMPVLRFEHPERIRKMCMLAKSSSVDLPDLLIGVCARSLGAGATKTFDKAAGKSSLFEPIRA